ncbi:MAG: hypothetical protein ACI9OO_000460, partial [Bacteroidia bacterium]
ENEVSDADRIFERSSVLATAIDARAQHFAAETPYVYQPFVGFEDQFRWDDSARKRLKNYSLKDLGI